MRVYLDNCCYNRPFDEQGELRVVVETIAKLQIQALMRMGQIEYAWSDVLGLEVLRNPFKDRQERILDWMVGAAVYVESTEDVVERGREIEALGVKPKDALHLASAEKAECDWFFTTDKGILKKVQRLGEMRVANPIEFAMEDDDDA